MTPLLLLLGLALPAAPAQPPMIAPVDRIFVDKSKRTMSVYRDGQVVRTFKVALGKGGLAPKVRQGDNRVPEGEYRIAGRNLRSDYYLSLRIGYPTPEQIEAARRGGYNPGGDIMIHGLPNGMGAIGKRHRRFNWTAGCIAVTNQEIYWLWFAVPDGTPIEIVQ